VADLTFAVLATSLARTASGNGEALDLTQIFSGYSSPPLLLVQSDVTVVSGTSPSLTVIIEDSIDGGVTWNSIITFTAQTAINRAVNASGIRGDAYPAGFRWPFNPKRVRARWTISGTNPNFTFSVKALLI
jgi:hypothetical protein